MLACACLSLTVAGCESVTGWPGLERMQKRGNGEEEEMIEEDFFYRFLHL